MAPIAGCWCDPLSEGLQEDSGKSAGRVRRAAGERQRVKALEIDAVTPGLQCCAVLVAGGNGDARLAAVQR